MKNSIVRFLVFFVPFVVTLYFLLYYFDKELFSEQDFFYSPFSVICFLFVSTLIIYATIDYINRVLPDKSGFAFLGFGMLKMFAAVIFLIPLIQSEVGDKIPAVFFFFVPYFMVLFIETFFVIRLINKK